MGKDNREWRKEVKKLRRSRIRKARAIERDKILGNSATVESESEDEEEETDEILEGQIADEREWILREEQAQLAFRMKQAEEQALAITREANEKRIRTEWEEIKKLESEVREEEDRELKEKNAKQEEEFNRLLDFLSGDIDNPPQPYLMPEFEVDGREICIYFARTAACRFFDRCERAHPRPTLSSTILIQNFFSHFSLEQTLRDEFDTDLSLEYEDADMHKEFIEFYEDVLPEFRAVGKVIQFKVCCNFAPHLRGNVYIQYDNIREAVQAYRIFNARYYNTKQLTVHFVKVPSWKSAICGLFNRRRCTKMTTCNFFHVFRNPTQEFVLADNDWAEPPPRERDDRKSRREVDRRKVNEDESRRGGKNVDEEDRVKYNRKETREVTKKRNRRDMQEVNTRGKGIDKRGMNKEVRDKRGKNKEDRDTRERNREDRNTRDRNNEGRDKRDRNKESRDGSDRNKKDRDRRDKRDKKKEDRDVGDKNKERRDRTDKNKKDSDKGDKNQEDSDRRDRNKEDKDESTRNRRNVDNKDTELRPKGTKANEDERIRNRRGADGEEYKKDKSKSEDMVRRKDIDNVDKEDKVKEKNKEDSRKNKSVGGKGEKKEQKEKRKCTEEENDRIKKRKRMEDK